MFSISKIYYYMKFILYTLYVFLFFGLWNKAPQYIYYLDYFIKILVSFILIFSFNPFRNTKFTEFHKEVAFSAGLFLLLSTSLTSFFENLKGTYYNIQTDIYNI